MAEPKFYWKINQQQVNHENKIFDVINEQPLQVGNDVRLTAKGAVFTRKTMDSGITFPACIREEFGTKSFSISVWFKTTSETANSTIFGNRSEVMAIIFVSVILENLSLLHLMKLVEMKIFLLFFRLNQI